MASYYVGSGGSDTNAGTSYATRVLTLTKAETLATSAGDTLYISPGTYREGPTLGASGGNAYTTGTVTATNGSTTVTGSGTTFTGGNVVAGYYFKTRSSAPILISAVNSATEIILASAYDGPTEAGITYATYNPIKWIGDYSGANTDGVGGIIRITGSGDDITITRTNCLIASSKNYRHFTGITFDIATYAIAFTSCTYILFDKCHTQYAGGTTGCFYFDGASQAHITVKNTYFGPSSQAATAMIHFTHSSDLSNTGHMVQNCVLQGSGRYFSGNAGIKWTNVGGCWVKNSTIFGVYTCCHIDASLAGGQVNTVNNCILGAGENTFVATTSGELIEDFNSLPASGNVGALRTNVPVGANSVSYPALFDSRWWFEATK